MKRKTGALHEDQYTFMTIPLLVLRVRNVLDKVPIQNQNTHFMCNNFFSKIVSFMR